MEQKNKVKASLEALKAKVSKAAFGAAVLAISAGAEAQSGGGLSKAKTVMETFKTELTNIIPTVAVIALLALGIGYATKFVEKDTFVRWAIGIIIAGSAAQLTALFFT